MLNFKKLTTLLRSTKYSYQLFQKSNFVVPKLKYNFTTQSQADTQKEFQADELQSEYKKMIGSLNIRKQTGRGIFSGERLEKLINFATKPKHEQLLMEAYYNFLGHYTVLPNKVVDKLINKIFEITPDPKSYQKILEIYKNHNYLCYFPHYNITLHLIQNISQENFKKLMHILAISPLIKFDINICNALMNKIESVQEKAIFSISLKILLQRYRFKLLGFYEKEEFLKLVVNALEKRISTLSLENVTKIAHTDEIALLFESQKQEINQQINYQFAILHLTCSNIEKFAEYFNKLKSEESIDMCFKFVRKIADQEYLNEVKTFLSESQINQYAKNGVEKQQMASQSDQTEAVQEEEEENPQEEDAQQQQSDNSQQQPQTKEIPSQEQNNQKPKE